MFSNNWLYKGEHTGLKLTINYVVLLVDKQFIINIWLKLKLSFKMKYKW